MKATVYSTDTSETRAEALDAAQTAIREKKTIVIPTDTVYGIAADAFSPEAVAELLAAKGRSRTMPPPVLIFDEAVLAGLADEVSEDARLLAQKFWPGALTLILYSQPSLQWDLGDTKGTVALRVPDDELAIDLLRQTGPLAVSSANKTGRIAANNADEAAEQLGESVELIIDGGQRPLNRAEDMSGPTRPSTIVDCTSDRLVVVREGAISIDELRQVVPGVVTKAELEELNRQAAVRRVDEAHAIADAEAAMAEEDFMPEPSDERAGFVGLSEEETDESVSYLPEEDAEELVNRAAPASAPEAGSLNANLLGSSHTVQAGAVDQIRTKDAHKLAQAAKTQGHNTKPVSVAEAKSLVFSETEN